MEYKEYKAKTVEDCITAACEDLVVPSSSLDYEVVETGSKGILGIGSKDAVIKARVKEEVKEETPAPVDCAPTQAVKKESAPVNQSDVCEKAKTFLSDVFAAMKLDASIECKFDDVLKELSVNIEGDDMGVLIGKRGQTLDSLQYLVSLVVNKGTGEYIRVKVDTENYRQRRKDTLENLAKNIAFKVKRTKHAVSLEPMNPYERRIIHSALQDDPYVTTHSEGEEPYRRVVVTLKR